MPERYVRARVNQHIHRPVPAVRRLEYALDAARAAFEAGQGRVACFIAEPIQGEGGDNHLSSHFLKAMQNLCLANDALFVLDEVQTGCGATGTAWAYQQLAIEPDLVAFGKKTQVCGVMAGRRVHEVPDNVFTMSSRINSTWGGSLADMVRATRILRAIAEENLFASATVHGQFLLSGLDALVAKYPNVLGNARGRGLMCALDVSHPAKRDDLIRRLYRDEHVIARRVEKTECGSGRTWRSPNRNSPSRWKPWAAARHRSPPRARGDSPEVFVHASRRITLSWLAHDLGDFHRASTFGRLTWTPRVLPRGGHYPVIAAMTAVNSTTAACGVRRDSAWRLSYGAGARLAAAVSALPAMSSGRGAGRAGHQNRTGKPADPVPDERCPGAFARAGPMSTP
jgi:hypothetical protein